MDAFLSHKNRILPLPLVPPKSFVCHYGFAYLRFTANQLCFLTHYTLISLHNIIIIATQHFEIVCIIMRNYAKWCKKNILRVPRFYRKDWKKIALVAREFWLHFWERWDKYPTSNTSTFWRKVFFFGGTCRGKKCMKGTDPM